MKKLLTIKINSKNIERDSIVELRKILEDETITTSNSIDEELENLSILDEILKEQIKELEVVYKKTIQELADMMANQLKQ